MTNLQTIAKQNLKIKAAMLLNRKPHQISLIIEHYQGVTVKCSDGNTLSIPFSVWVG